MLIKAVGIKINLARTTDHQNYFNILKTLAVIYFCVHVYACCYIFHGHMIVHCVRQDPSWTISSLFSLLQPQGPVSKDLGHCFMPGQLDGIWRGRDAGRADRGEGFK